VSAFRDKKITLFQLKDNPNKMKSLHTLWYENVIAVDMKAFATLLVSPNANYTSWEIPSILKEKETRKSLLGENSVIKQTVVDRPIGKDGVSSGTD
jgi:hypothetical protein